MEVTGNGMPKMNGQNVDVVDAFNRTGVSVADRGGDASEKYIIFSVFLV